MTKQEILDYFKDINNAYNECSRFDDLSRMLDELLKERETKDICFKVGARIFACEKCGYGLDDLYLTNEHDYPIDPVYCPYCGRKVM